MLAEEFVDPAWQLALPELTESSGLAFSRRNEHCIWTHNDSGGAAVLYAIDTRSGQAVGTCRLAGPKPYDWEDIASFTLDGQPMLLAADCGDNRASRQSIRLTLFREPSPNQRTTLAGDQVNTIDVQYPGGPLDCEAVWYDPDTQDVLLLGKRGLPFVDLYAVPIQAFKPASAPEKPGFVRARFVSQVAMPVVTGADRDPQTGDVWVVTYWGAWCYRRNDAKDLVSQLALPPVATRLPKWKQIEAIAIDRHSQPWVSSEGSPARLGRLSPVPSR